MSSLNDTTPEKSIWGYKGLIFGFLFFGLFLVGLIKALTAEPDYMPSQQIKRKQEALAQQQAAQASQTEATAKVNTENEATATAKTNEATAAATDDKKAQQ